jgi:hypothetical protein
MNYYCQEQQYFDHFHKREGSHEVGRVVEWFRITSQQHQVNAEMHRGGRPAGTNRQEPSRISSRQPKKESCSSAIYFIFQGCLKDLGKSLLHRKFKKFFSQSKASMIKSIEFEGIKVSYSLRGAGKPIVLLHGYLEAGEVWDPLAEALAGSFRMIVPDLPGHGKSGIKGEVHTMEFLASAVRR